MRLALAIAGLGLLVTPATAHDQWLTGEEVDPVLKVHCCGQNDTKLVDSLVRFAADGSGVYFIDQPDIIPFSRVQPSPDGHWWRSMADSVPTFTRCVFGPNAY